MFYKLKVCAFQNLRMNYSTRYPVKRHRLTNAIRVPVCARVSRVCPGCPPGVFLPLFTILPVQYSMYSVGGARALPHRYIVQ